MSLEQNINYQLNKFPVVKRILKHFYQLIMYVISPKIKSEGKIIRISPNDGMEYFFGYYDKSPWDATGRYMLCLKANDTWSEVSPKEPADILLIDTKKENDENDRVRKIADTRAWNVQMGCMLQWLGPDYENNVIFNDFRDGKFCSVILNIENGTERIVWSPVYTVSYDGVLALTLDFTRLYSLRPGYGYYNLPEKTKGIALPDEPCIWTVNLENGKVKDLLKYTDFANFQPRKEMQEKDSVHKVNHLMISPNGKRFMVLYRWLNGHRKYTRLITCNVDGTDMYILSDDDMVSHCYWKNDEEIIAFENKHVGGPGYYLMKDKTQEYIHLWPQLSNDGHPSYQPIVKAGQNRDTVVTDSYPDRRRIAEIKILKDTDIEAKNARIIARVFAPFKYDNDTRCDLHPRWSRDGKKIAFDSVFEGHRGFYMVDVAEESEMRKIKVAFLMTSCKKCGPVQQVLNIIGNLDRNLFEPILITLYDESKDGSSQLDKFLALDVPHFHCSLGKVDMLLGRTNALKNLINKQKVDVIHSLGVFPDLTIARMNAGKQIITIRNYVWQDYPAKFGKIEGTILALLHLYAIKRAAKTVTCSKSLSKIYKEKLGLQYDYICNGVDFDVYSKGGPGEKEELRKKLDLPHDKIILVYSGQFIDRKNQRFLLQTFTRAFDSNSNIYLLLLGDGEDLERLKADFGSLANVDFRGNVLNVNDYLKACDLYVSTSKSEGMPNGVLEAMASGLPVLLSDIPQHKEIFDVDSGIGELYKNGKKVDLENKLRSMLSKELYGLSEKAYQTVQQYFNANMMSSKYQELYKAIASR